MTENTCGAEKRAKTLDAELKRLKDEKENLLNELRSMLNAL